MIKVYIDGKDRTLDQVTHSWLSDEISSHRKVGENVCIRVSIKSGSLNMMLSTPACAVGGGGRRAASPQEKEIFDLWVRRGMNSNDFVVGQLEAFLNEIKHA